MVNEETKIGLLMLPLVSVWGVNKETVKYRSIVLYHISIQTNFMLTSKQPIYYIQCKI